MAAEPRITVAVLGMFWYDSLAEAARRITVPIEFVLQRDDEHISRDAGWRCSTPSPRRRRRCTPTPARTKEVPRFEADSAVQFFLRHLGRTVTG